MTLGIGLFMITMLLCITVPAASALAENSYSSILSAESDFDYARHIRLRNRRNMIDISVSVAGFLTIRSIAGILLLSPTSTTSYAYVVGWIIGYAIKPLLF